MVKRRKKCGPLNIKVNCTGGRVSRGMINGVEKREAKKGREQTEKVYN